MAPPKTALTPKSLTNEDAMLCAYMVEGRLDEVKVKQALDLVVKRWPVLGGRIHVDKESPSGYSIIESNVSPPFLYTYASRTEEDLPEIYPIPTPVEKPRLSDPPTWAQYLELFSPHPNGGFTFNDWVDVPATKGFFGTKAKPAAPILYLHVGNFRSHTVVGMRAAHPVFDEAGFALVLREWEKAMSDPIGYAAGPKIEMKFAGEGVASGKPFDPLKRFRELQEPVPTEIKGWAVWGAGEVSSYALKIGQGKLTSTYQRRCFHVPKESLAKIVARFNEEIRAENPDSKAFVSSGDVLAALLWKSTLKDVAASNSPTTFIGIANMRPLTSLLPSPWLGACGIMAPTTTTMSLLHSTSLLKLALSLRQTLNGYTPEEVEKITRWRLSRDGQRGRSVPIEGGSKTRTVSISNRVKTGADKVDFSGAAVEGEGKILHSISSSAPGVLLQDAYSIRASLDGTGFEIIGVTVASSWLGLLAEFEALTIPKN